MRKMEPFLQTAIIATFAAPSLAFSHILPAKFFRTNTFFNRISNLENSIFLGNLFITIKTIAQKQI